MYDIFDDFDNFSFHGVYDVFGRRNSLAWGVYDIFRNVLTLTEFLYIIPMNSNGDSQHYPEVVSDGDSIQV